MLGAGMVVAWRSLVGSFFFFFSFFTCESARSMMGLLLTQSFHESVVEDCCQEIWELTPSAETQPSVIHIRYFL